MITNNMNRTACNLSQQTQFDFRTQWPEYQISELGMEIVNIRRIGEGHNAYYLY